METWLSWTIVLALGGLYYLIQKSFQGSRRGRTPQRTTNTSTRKVDTAWLEKESASKPVAKTDKKKAPRKSVQKAVQEVGEKAEAYLSGASSTAGADADDDLSPAASPALGATTAATAPSGKDVSDMLEPRGSGPSVLRITPSDKPAVQQKPQPKREESSKESKKARQNKRKNEELKAQREADEKVRQALLEQQRRTAREARGEPAKNGLQPSKAPASNAWTQVRSAPVAAPSHEGQLLDTFDPDVVSTTSSSDRATNGTAPTPDSLGNSMHWSSLPSEEEQLRILQEQDAWTTVPKGRKQKRTKSTADVDGNEGTDSAPPGPALVKKASPQPTENVRPKSQYEVLAEAIDSTVSHPADSDWPVV
ncbi:hypothetical protein P154DRAFT_40322 [Amniculicola lignicola CBS 123094]|uniref:Uncharacterized protein n=1 Tax=Amniculicola lignicola CBS 123094 TaxID=1392246 RepID=A0A6A5W1P7_9PLEO|nr:hypothetical protein P154DRAFT_40322 [Amniculicola lignicola CBS 123094]